VNFPEHRVLERNRNQDNGKPPAQLIGVELASAIRADLLDPALWQDGVANYARAVLPIWPNKELACFVRTCCAFRGRSRRSPFFVSRPPDEVQDVSVLGRMNINSDTMATRIGEAEPRSEPFSRSVGHRMHVLSLSRTPAAALP
jgi:hypothetical protein